MMGFKKKLTSLLPSDARNHLQNVLTVEWEGQGKTVLVDLPDQSNEDNEVEMAGLTGSGGGGGTYGRLIDDDEDERPYQRPSRSAYNQNYDRHGDTNQPPSKHKNQSYASKSLPPLPPHLMGVNGAAIGGGWGGGGMRESSSNTGYVNQNPFEPEYNSPQPSSSSTYSSSPYTSFTPQMNNPPSFSNDNYAYNSNPNGREKKMPNPWTKYRADDIDLLGDLGANAVESPTSSRGTRDSAASNLENPFR
ncbi:uncharacterized protein IL334_004704 [Kwoniella shivajii]|uniref:Uncharacterized protein n=1 Tax=Kwoniella shivajii TaxID=564305 RepID=A0ABZ1D135_9TREE|nr:hypothetical protein IL334_004704 [Kwoniella shivajii]